MGHVHMPPLPATRKWKHLIDLIAGGAAAAQLATATIAAAEKGFRSAPNDPGVVEVYWLLVRLPIAARSADFADALRQCGTDVHQTPRSRQRTWPSRSGGAARATCVPRRSRTRRERGPG